MGLTTVIYAKTRDWCNNMLFKQKNYPYRKHFYNIQQMPYFQLYLFFNPTISTYGTILENNDRRRNGAGRGRATKTRKNSR